MMAYFCKRIRQSGRSKNFLADCHFLMEEDMAEIKFTSKEHKDFFRTMIQKSGNSDSYHRAFFYCIGISDTMRRNVGRIFDFEQDRIKPEGLHEGWQTGGTVRITRLAFNLWNGYMEQGEENGLAKEQQEVESLVNYLEGMESQFGKVLEELKEVRGQLTQIQDKGIRATAARVIDNAENKVQEIGSQISLIKQNLIRSAKNAVESFKEKGVDALRKVVSAMKIPNAFSLLKGGLHSGMLRQ